MLLFMIYTGLMRPKKTQLKKSGADTSRNAPGKSTYSFGNGVTAHLSDADLKHMARTDMPGHEWHPATPTAVRDWDKSSPHHTYMDYINGCKKCESLESRRMHPNGSKITDE